MNAYIDRFFLFCVKNRERIVSLFKISYVLLFVFTLLGTFAVYLEWPYYRGFLSMGKEVGEYAIPVYFLTMIPGIFRRFKKNHKLVSLLMIYRRYIGILVFFMVLYHYMIERGVTTIQFAVKYAIYNPFSRMQIYELMAVIAFFFLFLMAVTSNDDSTKRLGVWWGRIHALTYVTVWFMFLHVALQEINQWSLLLGVMGAFQVSSFIYKLRTS